MSPFGHVSYADPHDEETMTYEIPRRDRLDLFTPAERAIWDATQAVEAAGADVRLTEAINLLHAARARVADFVDGVDQMRQFREELERYREDLEESERDVRKLESCNRALSDEVARLTTLAADSNGVLGLLRDWTHAMGASLCPRGADTYGEGVRDCKAQVGRILDRLASPPAATVEPTADTGELARRSCMQLLDELARKRRDPELLKMFWDEACLYHGRFDTPLPDDLAQSPTAPAGQDSGASSFELELYAQDKRFVDSLIYLLRPHLLGEHEPGGALASVTSPPTGDTPEAKEWVLAKVRAFIAHHDWHHSNAERP